MKEEDYKKILDYFVKMLNDTCKGKIYVGGFALRGKYVLVDHPIVEITFITNDNRNIHYISTGLDTSVCATTCHKYFNKLKHLSLNDNLCTSHTLDKIRYAYMTECLQDLLMMDPIELMVKADLDE